MKKLPRLPLSTLVLPLALLSLPACEGSPSASSPSAAQGTSAARGLPDNDSKLAHDLVAKGGLLIDVRGQDEYAGKHLEGAVNIPVDEMQDRWAEIDKLAGGDKKKPIVVYCSSGGRSRAAKKMLVKAGYEQVTNLGQMSRW